jgi:hypothetical protein
LDEETLTLGLKLALNPVTKLGDSIEESINVMPRSKADWYYILILSGL